ncbi:MAG: hypothetical protein EBW12_07900, partial [Actinobacteria bacterium]|nr:hypothetical protein [Actinomycetota bacterium]
MISYSTIFLELFFIPRLANGTLQYSSSIDQTLSGNILTTNSGGALTKDTNTSVLTLSGSGSNFAGAVQISTGTIVALNANALGVSSGITVSDGAGLQLSGGIAVGAIPLTLSGNGPSSAGALSNVSGTSSYAGAITLTTSAVRINSVAGSLTLSGNITYSSFGLTIGGAGNTTISGNIGTGGGTLTKDGTGILVLSGTNSYTGSTTVSNGTLVLSNNSALGATSNAITVSSGATLQLSGVTIGANPLSLTGTGYTGTGGSLVSVGNNVYQGSITLGSNTTINTYSGLFNITGSSKTISGTNTNLTFVGAGTLVIDDAISIGTGSLTQNGAGITYLQNTNTYSGGSYLSSGTLAPSAIGALGSGKITFQGGSVRAFSSTNSDQTALYNKFNLLTTSGTYSIDPGNYTVDFTTSGFTGSGAGFAVVANSGISGTTGSWTAASSSSGK